MVLWWCSPDIWPKLQEPWSFPGRSWCMLLWLFYSKETMYSKNKKEVAQQLTNQAEEYGKFSQKTRLFTQAYETMKSPPKVDSPLKLQALCLAVFHKGMKSFISSPGDSLLNLKVSSQTLFHTMIITQFQAQTWLLQESSESLRLQVIETKDILRASQNKRQIMWIEQNCSSSGKS